MAASVKRIAERISTPFRGSRVDRERGVIYGALLCGASSANGRDYDRTSFGDLKQYEGRPVYMNHGRDRMAQDKVGWVENVRFRDDGRPEGDIHVLTSHAHTAPFLEAAERNPSLFGLSHVARCRTARGSNGRERVEAVEEVESIDIVADPATTKGFFESRRTAVPTTLRAVIESVRPTLPPAQAKRARKLLLVAEDDAGVGAMLDVPVDEPAAGGNPDEALWGGFQAAIQAILDGHKADGGGKAAARAAAKEIQKYLVAHADLTGSDGGAEGDDPESDGGGGEEEPKSESRKARLDAITESLNLLAPGLTTDLEILVATPAAARKAAADRLKAVREATAAERPVSAARRQVREAVAATPKRITWDD